MATADNNYTKLRAFLNAFPKNVESKKDLLKIRDKSLLGKYYAYRKYFQIDRRLRPSNVISEMKRFKRDNIYFKSEELGINLTNHDKFNSTDRYTSSSKLIAKITKAMLGQGITLNTITSYNRSIDIRYNVTANRKVVEFDTQTDNVDFMVNLPPDIYLNIGNTAYNKNGLDFEHDYHNQSNDFANNLIDYIKEENMFLYKF